MCFYTGLNLLHFLELKSRYRLKSQINEVNSTQSTHLNRTKCWFQVFIGNNIWRRLKLKRRNWAISEHKAVYVETSCLLNISWLQKKPWKKLLIFIGLAMSRCCRLRNHGQQLSLKRSRAAFHCSSAVPGFSLMCSGRIIWSRSSWSSAWASFWSSCLLSFQLRKKLVGCGAQRKS